MQRKDFTPDAPGDLVDNLNGSLTFVPKPLPGPVRLDNELVNLLTAAERALGRVTGATARLPDPGIVTRAFIRREAQLSSRIENTHAELDELAVAAEQQDRGKVPRAKNERHGNEIQEVANNQLAIEFAIEQVHVGRPVSTSLLREMHAMLLQGTRGEALDPGEYRSMQVFIGRGFDIDDAALVPPPPHVVPELMEQLNAYLQTPDEWQALIRNGMIHYQFETIHPFGDGNGRTGRALILLLMCVDGVLELPTLNPSLHMEREREEYYLRLREVSTRNKWQAWLKFFARSISVAAEDAYAKIDRIVALQADYRTRLQRHGRSALMLKLVDHLFSSPAITKKRAAGVLNASVMTGGKHVEQLVSLGIIEPVAGMNNPQVYIAREIIDAMK